MERLAPIGTLEDARHLRRMASRRTTADLLKEACISYLLKRGYSCFTELGLNSWGKLRADVIGMNLRADLVIFEVKSAVADYASDLKWRQYAQFSNRMYFVFTEDVFSKLKSRLADDLRGTGVGASVLCEQTGYLRIVMPAKKNKMVGSVKRTLVIRMAWRGGRSKRLERRKRIYIG